MQTHCVAFTSAVFPCVTYLRVPELHLKVLVKCQCFFLAQLEKINSAV